jgi:hypothetical protein
VDLIEVPNVRAEGFLVKCYLVLLGPAAVLTLVVDMARECLAAFAASEGNSGEFIQFLATLKTRCGG